MDQGAAAGGVLAMYDPAKCDNCTADDCYYGTEKCPQYQGKPAGRPRTHTDIQPSQYADRADYVRQYNRAYFQRVGKAKRNKRKVVALAGES